MMGIGVEEVLEVEALFEFVFGIDLFDLLEVKDAIEFSFEVEPDFELGNVFEL